MFLKPAIYCSYCKSILHFGPKGICPECKSQSLVFPEFIRVVKLRTKETKRLTDKYPFALHWFALRGEMEWGMELGAVLREAKDRMVKQYSGVFLPTELPKLDIVAVALSHQETDDRVVIHDDLYDSNFYWHSVRHRPVNMQYAQAGGIVDQVFQSDKETPEKVLRFFELQSLLHLLKAQNRLWFGLLAEGFYVMPDRIHGWSFQPQQQTD